MTKVAVDGEDLIEEIKHGSTQAFEQFYDQYVQFVFGIALKMLKNENDAEDLCHDVFIEIYNNPYSFDANRGSVRAWIAVKTKSRCLDRIRKNKYVVTKEENHIFERAKEHDLVEDEVLTKVDREIIHKALNHLPETQKEAIYGNYFKQYSHKELSKKLDRPLGTIKSLVRYGMKNLRKYYHQFSSSEASRGEKKNEM